MLIQNTVNCTKTIPSFTDLCTAAIDVLQRTGKKNRTIVLGPVTDKDPEIVEENLWLLTLHGESLAQNGWVVLDLPSFQPIIEALIQKHGIEGYPVGVLHEFTLPLIKSGVFTRIHFRQGFERSFGTTVEHDAALGHGIEVTYL